MALKKLDKNSADKVVNLAAEYHKDNPVYQELANAADAKNWFVSNIGSNIRDIIDLGMSYDINGTYVIACNITDLQRDNPKLFEETFSMYRATLKQIERERSNIIFICLIIPKKGYVDVSTLKALNEFLKFYDSNDNIILTDGIHCKDIDYFSKSSGASEINMYGMTLYRWR